MEYYSEPWLRRSGDKSTTGRSFNLEVVDLIRSRICSSRFRVESLPKRHGFVEVQGSLWRIGLFYDIGAAGQICP